MTKLALSHALAQSAKISLVGRPSYPSGDNAIDPFCSLNSSSRAQLSRLATSQRPSARLVKLASVSVFVVYRSLMLTPLFADATPRDHAADWPAVYLAHEPQSRRLRVGFSRGLLGRSRLAACLLAGAHVALGRHSRICNPCMTQPEVTSKSPKGLISSTHVSR